MIRINLLGVERARAKKKAAKFDAGQQITVGCSLILLVAALGIGWWYWSLQRHSADLDRQIAEAQQETARLQSVLQQVRDFEARRGQLQQRVTLIEELRKGQTGPVHLLDGVSQALPDTMWLLELRQAGVEVTIDGRCLSLNALSDFVSGLEAADLFEQPVEIVDSRVEPAAGATPELIRFSVRARVKGATPSTQAN